MIAMLPASGTKLAPGGAPAPFPPAQPIAQKSGKSSSKVSA